MSEASDQEKKHAPQENSGKPQRKETSLGLQSSAERRLSSPRLQPCLGSGPLSEVFADAFARGRICPTRSD